jgi:hypothetical protein
LKESSGRFEPEDFSIQGEETDVSSRHNHPDAIERPAVFDKLTVTQLTELISQVDEEDREGFEWRAEQFGWSKEQIDQVWDWLVAEPRLTPDSGEDAAGVATS